MPRYEMCVSFLMMFCADLGEKMAVITRLFLTPEALELKHMRCPDLPCLPVTSYGDVAV